MSVSDEAAAYLSKFDASEECSFFTDGCCGDPDDHDYCGMCPLATTEHPDRNGGFPGAPTRRSRGVSELVRVPVRRFASGTTHLADIEIDHAGASLVSLGVAFWAPLGPIDTLCMVTLPEKDVLVHMKQMGTSRTSPKGCARCLRLAARDPREIVGHITEAAPAPPPTDGEATQGGET